MTGDDRAHIHNYIIFNSTNLACDRKFRNYWFIALALQKLSDLICLENGLSVIEPRKPSERAKRLPFPQKETFQSIICADMDAALLQKPKNYDDFCKLLMEQGYEFKRGKNPAVRGKGQKRFIRLKSLGDGYNPEDIEKIISEEKEQTADRKKNAKHSKHVKRDFDLLIGIQEKLKQGKGGGYERWAKAYNIKQISQALLFLQEHDVRDYATLAKRASAASSRFSSLSTTIKNTEKRLNEVTNLKKHIFNYSKTKDVYEQYRKSGYSKKFHEAHREEITIHKVAKKAFSGEASFQR